jgi:ATP-binding cassette, subfamily B, bacterial MsbA
MAITNELLEQPGVVYRRLLRYTLRHWQVFALALLFSMLNAATDTAIVYLMKPLLDGSFVEKNPMIIRWIPAAFLVLIMLRGVFAYLAAYNMSWVGRRVVHDMRSEIFDQFLRLPVQFYDHQAYGNLLTRLTYHVEQIAESVTGAVATMVREGMTAIGMIALLFYLNWRMAIFILVVAPIVVLMVRIISQRFRRYSSRIQDSMGDVTHVGEELITGHRVVKVFGGEQYERKHFAEVNEKNTRLNVRLARTKAAATPIIQLPAAWVIAAVIYFATRDSMLAQITPGTFMAFLGALMGLNAPIKQLSMLNATLQKGIAAAADIFKLLNQPGEPVGGQRALSRAQGDLHFEGLGFVYPQTSRRVLQDIELRIAPGQTVAFVGRSGAGKSTLLSLLPRFYDATEGCIRLDGHDIRDYPMRDLRRQIAFVPQSVTLFNDSIARNIAYGDMEDTPEPRIIEAAKHAHAWEFIEPLPEGLHTRVGQNGVLLSGGQRQRLAIARALLKDAPILILDEATSALDTDSERKIQEALEYLMRRCTTLVIAHRLSTIQKADLIVVMEQGRVVEQGKHADLLTLGGHYAALHAMQFHEPGEE